MTDVELAEGQDHSSAEAVDDRGLDGGTSHAYGINNRGQVVGWRAFPDWDTAAFLWEDGRTTQLPALTGATGASADAINEHGVVAGSSPLPGDTGGWRRQAVIWR